MPMNPEVKARWVAALRSGEYKQGKNALKAEDESSFCCLGVLCDLYAKQHEMTVWTPDELGDPSEDGCLPGEEVLDWAEIAQAERVVIDGQPAPLYSHNDGVGSIVPRTFAEIADAIEAQL